jgi:hypothetical protein
MAGSFKVVFEIMYTSGLLLKEDNNKWVIPEDVGRRWLFLVRDGLSIHHVREAEHNILLASHSSFTASYETAKVFAKAFERVSTIPGDLHMGFHTLGPVYTLFMEASYSQSKAALAWKRLKATDVTECCKVASQLV